MVLNDKISAILEGINIEERDNGRLVLHSQPLEDIQKPYLPSHTPILRNVIDYVAKVIRNPKKKKIQHLIAKNLGDYLDQKIAGAESDSESEQLKRIQTSFNDYHNVRINHLAVNHNDINRPNFFVRNLGYFVGCSIIAARNIVPALEALPNYIVYPAVCGAYIYTFKKSENQKVDFAVPSIDEIKEDVAKLSENYRAAKEKYPGEMDSLEITVQQLKELLPKLLPTMSSQDVEKFQQFIDGKDQDATIIFRGTKTDQYDPEKISEMKADVDRYVQQHCPTLDLENVCIEVSKMRSGKGGGISPFRKNVVKISRSSLDNNMKGFYRIYAHELAHIDGVSSEGMADYQAMQVISEMQEEFPDQRHEFEFFDTLLTAAVHTYVIERKKSIRKGKTKIAHLGDVIGYNAKKVLNGVLRKEQPSPVTVGINQRIHDELVESGTPEDIVKSVFETYENPALGSQFFFGLQHVIKNDEFMGGYTKDLYEVMKHYNKI